MKLVKQNGNESSFCSKVSATLSATHSPGTKQHIYELYTAILTL